MTKRRQPMVRTACRLVISVFVAWAACQSVYADDASSIVNQINAAMKEKSQRVKLNLAREFLNDKSKFTELLAVDGGVEAFNALRTVDDTYDVNIMKVNLNGFDLKNINWELAKIYWSKIRGANLSGANLRGAYLHHCHCQESQFVGADLRPAPNGKRTTLGNDADFIDSSFTEAILDGAEVGGALFAASNFIKASLVGITASAPASFRSCSLHYADLTDAELPYAIFRRAIMPNANLTRTFLAGADLESAEMRGAKIYKTNFGGANLSGAVMHFSDLRTATLANADLSNAGLLGANLSRVDLEGAVLNEIHADGANLSGANLSGVRMRAAALIGADLSGANLRGADLEGALFTRANLRDSDLTDADLRGAELTGADLTGANLTDAKIENTILESANISTGATD